MKSVARMALKSGMELGENVYSYKNELILPKDTIIDDLKIAKLARYSIMCVSIKEPVDYATTHFEKIRISPSFKEFEKIYNNNLSAYKYMIDDFMENGLPININFLLQIHDNIKACAKTNEQLLEMLYYMLPSEDDMTYAHCLNSALISSVFGSWLLLPEDETRTLTLCGFFYDIGKLKIPYELIWAPGRLSEEEFEKIKTHTTLGYELLKNQKIDPHIKNAVLMHHERLDGSGYPNHLKDKEIDMFAKYIAIIDSYEAMTSARTYRQSMNPFQVIRNFEDSGFEKYGSVLIRPILEHIASSQIGRVVTLSNEQVADIILINKNHLSKPLVKVDHEIIDLSKRTDDLVITSFV